MTTTKPYALLINDIHAGKDNIEEFERNWVEAITLCKTHGIDKIIVGGDLWQSRSSQSLHTLMSVRDMILMATNNNIDLIIASGNHDLIDQEALASYNHIFSGYHRVTVIDESITLQLSNKVRLYVMRYYPENGSFSERLNKIIDDVDFKAHTNILYCHEGIRGGIASSTEEELPAKIFKPFDEVLVGHYHDRNKIKGTNIEYIGASRQHNFGEDEEKGYTIIFIDGSTKFIKNEANMRYKVLDIALEEMDDNFIQELERIKADGRYKIKVRVNCNSSQVQNVDKQKLVEIGATKVELITEQTEALISESEDLNVKYDKSGIRKQYQTFCNEKEITDVDFGLHYIDKISNI